MTTASWIPADTFASRLIEVRRALGLTVEQAADRCGLKRPTWGSWESGALPRNMAAVVARIALATGVDRDWLMFGGERPAPDPRVTPRYRAPVAPSGRTDLRLAA